MSNVQHFLNPTVRNCLLIVLAFSLIPLVASGQPTQNHAEELATAIARVKSGDQSARDIEIIALSKAVQAVPALEEQFSVSADVARKSKIANALVRLGDSNSTYWNYLLEQATLAVDSNVPDSLFSDSRGTIVTKEASPELQEWAHTHNLSTDTAREYATYDLPGKVWQLAQTGDARGIPLLRRALHARNCLVASTAAKGLAQAKDNDSIPLIIAAARRSKGCSGAIALGLIYFDDARAQTAVDAYAPKDMARLFRDGRAQGLGPFGYNE